MAKKTLKACRSLKDPTCGECADAAGLVAISSAHTVYMDECANCGQRKGVSAVSDYKRPGTPTRAEAWD